MTRNTRYNIVSVAATPSATTTTAVSTVSAETAHAALGLFAATAGGTEIVSITSMVVVVARGMVVVDGATDVLEGAGERDGGGGAFWSTSHTKRGSNLRPIPAPAMASEGRRAARTMARMMESDTRWGGRRGCGGKERRAVRGMG